MSAFFGSKTLFNLKNNLLSHAEEDFAGTQTKLEGQVRENTLIMLEYDGQLRKKKQTRVYDQSIGRETLHSPEEADQNYNVDL